MEWPVRNAGHKLYFIRPHDGQHRFVVLLMLPRRRRDCCVLRLIAPLSFEALYDICRRNLDIERPPFEPLACAGHLFFDGISAFRRSAQRGRN